MPAPVSRRAALVVLALGATAASGCDVEDLDPRSAPTTPTVTPTLLAPAPADEQADVATLGRALAETVAALALVEAVARRHRRLRPHLGALARMHRTHRDLLAEAAPDTDAPAVPRVRTPAHPARALALVRSHEDTSRRRYVGWALEARSGAFARLLAGMSAGVAQHVSVLPDEAR